MALAGDHVQVLVGAYELTGDHNRISIDDKRELHDVTAFGDAVHTFVLGKRQFMLDHAGYFNADTARSHPVLKGVSVSGIVSLLIGQNAAPAVGDPVYSQGILQGKYGTLPEVNKFVPFGAMFANAGSLGGWGALLTPPVSFTNTNSGSSLDNGAASANGGAAFLHVLQAAGSDTYSIVIEGSTTGAFGGEETTLGTFTLDGSALGSERIALAGSIPRYTRYLATRSGSAGDTVKITISLVRF